MPDSITVDYIVVGAGSAGCVLANRLSADSANQVFLLEAGSDDRPWRNLRQFWSNMLVHTPVGFGETLHDANVNWLYETEEDPSTLNRKHLWPRGKVLGGSSSINGLLYVRGQRADYDGWRQMGCEGWSADDVLPPLILVGDGAFQMTGWELSNCRRYGFALVVVLFNNASWEMLRAFQPESKFNDLDDWNFAAISPALDRIQGRTREADTK